MGDPGACVKIYDTILAATVILPGTPGPQLQNCRIMIALCSLPFLFIGSIMPVDQAIPGAVRWP
jgi:hypothetical protein